MQSNNTTTNPNSQALITVEGVELERIEYRGQAVLTLRQMDEVHERPEGTAKRAFQTHKEKLIENEDYFFVPYEEWQSMAGRNSSHQKGGNTGPLTMLTKSGYLMLVKSFQDDHAWDVQRGLVKCYFVVEEMAVNKNHPSVTIPEILSPRTIKRIESTYRAAYRFGLTYGLEGNQLKLSAESLTLKATGYLPSRLLDAPALVAPTQDRLIGVKEIAPEVGVNERAVNPLLIQMGFQESYRDHKNKVQYNLLEPGKEYGVLLDVPNVNGGTPKQHIKWRRDVIPLVHNFLKKTGEKVLMLAENH